MITENTLWIIPKICTHKIVCLVYVDYRYMKYLIFEYAFLEYALIAALRSQITVK